MLRYNKSFLALLVGFMTVIGAASFAEARPARHIGHGGPWATPETQQMMEKAYNDIAPLQLELYAKQQELTAKIYGNADDKTVQQLTAEVSALQKQLTEARVKMQQDFAKAGIPMQHGCGGMMGGGMMGGGMMGGGMMGGGRGFTGGCPGFGGPGHGFGGPASALPDADSTNN